MTHLEIPELRHSGRAKRNPEPRGNIRVLGPWVPGSPCGRPGMTVLYMIFDKSALRTVGIVQYPNNREATS